MCLSKNLTLIQKSLPVHAYCYDNTYWDTLKPLRVHEFFCYGKLSMGKQSCCGMPGKFFWVWREVCRFPE